MGHAMADGPSGGYGGVKVALNVIQLSDGMELRAPDQHMLTNLKIGEWVKVDFVADGRPSGDQQHPGRWDRRDSRPRPHGDQRHQQP
jgi:hypothetical protein